METQQYVVTVHDKTDLEDLYRDMEQLNCECTMRRPLSRNTHYSLTEQEAQDLRNDSRVWAVELVDNFRVALCSTSTNLQSYQVSGNFWKDDTEGPATVSAFDRQWGHLHCSGSQAQRGLGDFGSIAGGGTYEQVSATTDVYNNGQNADVVIVDDPVSYDNGEWVSPTTSNSRFVQYQWFNELNSVVSGIDDDNQSLPIGTITYGTSATTSQYHGNHVTGTVAGRHYGWAPEANIYNLTITNPWPSGQTIPALLIFDYLRAFHRTKPNNPTTGRKNPTITNHSYGAIYFTPNSNLTLSDVTSVTYQYNTYTIANPGPSGWTEAGVEADFGIRFGVDRMPVWFASLTADVQDALEEGIVIVGSAGNDNLLVAQPNDVNWNNTVTIQGNVLYYNRGAAPITPDSNVISVGALSKSHTFTKAGFSNYGPGVTVFAPGENILSAYGNTGGIADSKYSAGNYFFPISGTSMAAPQVAGAAALLATNSIRLTNEDVIGYLENTNIQGELSIPPTLGDTPNKVLKVISSRKATGQMQTIKGSRKPGGQVFPRPNINT